MRIRNLPPLNINTNPAMSKMKRNSQYDVNSVPTLIARMADNQGAAIAQMTGITTMQTETRITDFIGNEAKIEPERSFCPQQYTYRRQKT